MSSRIEGANPIEVGEDGQGRIVIRQETGEGSQTVTLGISQAEHLQGWLQGYLAEAQEDAMEE